MRKIYLLTAAAIAMASCTSNEEVYDTTAAQQEKEIAFKGYNQSLTRAATNAVQTATTLDHDRPMYVSARYTNKAGNYETYFEDLAFTYQTNQWTAGWYYPLQGKMSFLAYSTDFEKENFDAHWTYAEGGISKLELAFGDKLDGVTDVLYSNIWHELDCPQENSQVLTFKHALAWLNFTLKLADEDLADKITINSIIVNDVNTSGTATITPNAALKPGQSVETTCVWSTSGGAEDVSVAGTLAPLTDEALTVGTGLLILPTKQTSFTINYTIKNGAETSTVDKTLEYTHDFESGKWLAGNKYTYNFTINLHEITFTANVTGYDNQTAVDIPESTPAEENGDDEEETT